MDPFTAIAALIGLIGTGVSAAISARNNDENLDYAKSTTQAQWERDDNSYQRTVKDVTAAGFSPLAALDGGLVPNSSPLGYQGQAPQFDLNNTVSALLQAGKHQFESSESTKRASERLNEIQVSFENTIKTIETQENIKNEHESELKENEYLNSLNVIKAQLEASKSLEATKSLLELQKAQKEFLISKGVTEFTPYNDWNDYVTELCDYVKYINNGLLDYQNQSFKVPESTSGNASVNVAVVSGSGGNSETRSISVSEYVRNLFTARPFPEYTGSAENKKPLTESQKEVLKKLYFSIDLNEGGFSEEEKAAMPQVPNWEEQLPF